jgi:hypothetical protein
MNINKKNKIIKSNIELLRIFAMIIIIAHHATVHGVFKIKDVWKYENKINLLILKMFQWSGKISNALFFMICGYFHIKKNKLNLNSIIWKTCFYGFLISIIGKIAKFFKINDFENENSYIKLNLLKFNPLTSGIYWFITVYIILIIFSLELNKFLNKLNKLGYIIFLIFFYIIWYYISYYYGSGYFELKSSIFFYCIGGYLKLFPKKKKLFNLFIFLIIGIIGYIFSMELEFIKKLINLWALKYVFYNNRYIYLFGIPLSSYGFFNFFNLLDIENWKIINIFGKSCYAIYLIHDSYVLRIIIWKYITKIQEKFIQKNFPLNFTIIIFKVFFFCSLIEIFQQNFIEFYALNYINKIIEFLKEKFILKYEEITTIKENIEIEKLQLNTKI